ncbi:hypothetical protein ACTD5D_40280 [Nocardia takedensis]|uniref:hypothetical protein n=1 Tax=Nocardia takedensis TaxID=259390 RepID=UPI003F75DBEF
MTSNTSPAFVVVHDNPTPFTIDEAAFARWISRCEEWEGWLPERAAEAPGNDLSSLVHHARDHHVLIGDPRLALQVNGDDDIDTSGCYVLLHNTFGTQRLVGITSGWSELTFPEENTPFAEAARFHLEQVRDIANWLLCDIRTPPEQQPPPRPPADTEPAPPKTRR